ncbi:MAG: ABC transporter permease subunit [Verrucomicrobiota bacterium]
MTFLPIVERELRIASRRRGTYWTRILAAMIALGVAGIILMTDSPRITSVQLGKNIFATLAWFAFFYCLLIGARNTADCIAEERREGTLGLLFLTDLKGYDVVIGKLVASSLNSVYAFAAIFPVLAIPILLGGTPPERVWLVVLILSNTLFFSLAAGMWVSTVTRGERSTFLLTLLLILFVTVGIPVIGLLIDEFGPKPYAGAGKIFYLPSPITALGTSFENWTGRQIPAQLWSSVLCTHVIAWGMLLLAFYRLPRTWQDKAASVSALRWRERWRQWSHGDSMERKSFRQRLVDVNPCFWLTARDRLKPAYVWAVLGVAGCLWFWGWIEMKKEWLDEGFHFLTGFTLFTLLKWWLASEACQRFCEDRRSGALELILCTPIKVEEVLRGQLLALRRQFFWPAVIVLAVVFLFMVSGRGNEGWVMLCAAGMVMFIADLYTMSWLGMWQGLRARYSMRAVGSVIFRILFLPWIILVLLLIFASIANVRAFDKEDTFLGLWFGLGMVNNLVHFLWARQGLMEDFRTIATTRYDAKLPTETHAPKAKPAEVKAPVPAAGG